MPAPKNPSASKKAVSQTNPSTPLHRNVENSGILNNNFGKASKRASPVCDDSEARGENEPNSRSGTAEITQ